MIKMKIVAPILLMLSMKAFAKDLEHDMVKCQRDLLEITDRHRALFEELEEAEAKLLEISSGGVLDGGAGIGSGDDMICERRVQEVIIQAQ